jgi:tetratricopeptide (TPR) repeat protein
MCDLALAEDRKNLQALRIKVIASLTQGNIDEAMKAAQQGLDVKKTTDTYFYHGKAAYAAMDYETALADFEEVIEMNYMYERAYIGQSESLLQLAAGYTGHTMKMRAMEKIIRQSTLALDLNPESKDALIVRSLAYAEMKDYPSAINDVSKVVAIEQADADVYWLRARYYKDFGQYQNAINDLNRVLSERDQDADAYLMRADCHAANLNNKAALKDLEKVNVLRMEQGENTEALVVRIQEAQKQLFEEFREYVKPFIELGSPSLSNNQALVSTALNEVVISGDVEDDSPITLISVNGEEIPGDITLKRRRFNVSIPITSDTMRFVLQAEDIYGNRDSLTFSLKRTEGDAPDIQLFVDGLREGMLEILDTETELILKGVVKDESLIKFIQVNGESVLFGKQDKDPSFQHQVELAGVKEIVVLAEDMHGNTSSSVVAIKRIAVPVAAAPVPETEPAPKKSVVEVQSRGGASLKPANAKTSLGITWVVFIENDEYAEFPSINTSSEEIRKMKKAFSSYTVHNTIRKKNLSKSQMERFFKTELRDLVRKNNVNAVLVWYSGHGKYKASKNYWIPVDAKKDNQYTYYDATAIKAVMKAYGTSVRHTMVVADAVGTDPSFYEMTR